MFNTAFWLLIALFAWWTLGLVVVLLWDGWLYFKYGEPATISWNWVVWCRRAPIIPMLVGLVIGGVLGILIGHLGWQNGVFCH